MESMTLNRAARIRRMLQLSAIREVTATTTVVIIIGPYRASMVFAFFDVSVKPASIEMLVRTSGKPQI